MFKVVWEGYFVVVNKVGVFCQFVIKLDDEEQWNINVGCCYVVLVNGVFEECFVVLFEGDDQVQYEGEDWFQWEEFGMIWQIINIVILQDVVVMEMIVVDCNIQSGDKVCYFGGVQQLQVYCLVVKYGSQEVQCCDYGGCVQCVMWYVVM